MRLVQLLCILGLTTAAILAQHDHEEEETFHEVQEFFGINGTTIPRQETNLLIRHMLYRSGCHTNSGIDCTACLNTDTVLAFLNRTTEGSLDEEAFHKLSVVLVVFMKDPVTECAVSETTLGPGGRSFQQFLTSMAGGEDHLTDHLLEEILHDMKHFHKDGSLKLNDDGSHVSGPTVDYSVVIDCVSPETILEHADVDSSVEVTEEQLEHTAAYIITKVLQGSCLSPKGLPAPSNFLSSIFSEYADGTSLTLEEFESMLKKVGIGGDEHDEDGHEDHGHEEEEGHDHATHRRRRDTENAQSRRVKRADGHDHPGEMHAGETHDGEHAEPFDVTKNCYSAENLLDVFVDTNTTPSVDPATFSALCPAIVQQLLSGVCSHKEEEEEMEKTSTAAEANGYGTIAVFIITLCTLLGAPFVSIRNKAIQRRILAFLMAVAIGTLLGDSALHLIPEGTGIHGHDEHDHAHSTEELEIEPYVWKMTAFLASLYAFFLLEIIMSKEPSHSHSHDFTDGSIPSDKEDQTTVKTKINKSLVAMICIGDALHNFADGLAIGAAFSFTVAGGLSTSLAVFCHELPHELGDFAALVNGGLTIKKAMIMNFVSGLTAFIGLYVGVALGDDPESRGWIFILAAGMFIYVALADLVPEVKKMFTRASDAVIIFICLNLGVIVGYVIMFVIAVFESRIKVLV